MYISVWTVQSEYQLSPFWSICYSSHKDSLHLLSCLLSKIISIDELFMNEWICLHQTTPLSQKRTQGYNDTLTFWQQAAVMYLTLYNNCITILTSSPLPSDIHTNQNLIKKSNIHWISLGTKTVALKVCWLTICYSFFLHWLRLPRYNPPTHLTFNEPLFHCYRLSFTLATRTKNLCIK